MIIPESVTFEDAIALTESIMAQIIEGTLSQTEIAEAITALVNTENGARGFFVTYLTSPGTLADYPLPEIIEGLRSSPDTVAEFLVKNLAMSSAMAITHRRNSEEEMARESDKVRSRTITIIEQVALPQVRELALALRESAITGEGSYKTFLERWQYDAQQREVICQAIDRLIAND